RQHSGWPPEASAASGAIPRHRAVTIAPFIEDELDVLVFQRRHLLDILVPRIEEAADAVGYPAGFELQRILHIHKRLFLSVEYQLRICIGVFGQKIDVVGAVGEQPTVPVIQTVELIGQLCSNGRLPNAREKIPPLLRTADGLLADAGPAQNHLDLRVHRLHGLDDVVVLHPVLVQRHAASLPGAVQFVADRPAADIEGLGTAVLRAHSAHAGVYGAVAVLNLLGRLARRSVSAVDRQIGLRSHQPVEGDEVMQAYVVRLVATRRALVTIAKTVAPVVSGDKVAAGPLEHFEAFLFEEADHAGLE